MVYFVQEAGEDGFIKIGYVTDELERRITTMQTGNARQLALVGVLTAGTKADERYLHKRFREHRILISVRGYKRLAQRGEWFKPHKELLAFIDSLPPYPPPIDRSAAISPIPFRSTNS